MAEKIVLAYSGGLDTSVAIKWLQDRYQAEIVALTVDVGAQDKDLERIREKALKIGAVKALVIDAKESFVKYFCFPALRAGAIYEGEYPLATALARPLIAKLLVDVARQENATAIAHGCTGKGNDQVRFDVATKTLAPDLKVIAPMREWIMSREQEMEYAAQHGIPVPTTVASPYSTDENLWGRSSECGHLEDAWNEPLEEVYWWTRNAGDAPDEPEYVEIGFEQGIPVSLNGQQLDAVSMVYALHEMAGKHGVGRIDHVENRLVGIKSREIYEAPAAVVLHAAHKALEDMTLTKDTLRFKSIVAVEYADLIYNGLWFSPLHQDLAAFVASTQRYVTGTIRVKLFKGQCVVVGRKSPLALYNVNLATYDKGDVFDYKSAEGFITLWGLPLRTQAQVQGMGVEMPKVEIMPPATEQ
jgi:argininosuccinate synthase